MKTPGNNDLGVTLHCPPALSTREGDGVRGLPPSAPVKFFDVDRHPACPGSWVRGDKRTASYFVPVKPETGLWLDFNSCWAHDHDVAVVVSVQGLNPVDGKSQLEELSLKQYLKAADGEPPQNYLATTTTPPGLLWLDGFRTSDGEVRQWVFTKEQMRGIATHVLGSKRVFSIGVAFFLSKEKHGARTLAWPYNFYQAMAAAEWQNNIMDTSVKTRITRCELLVRSSTSARWDGGSITYSSPLGLNSIANSVTHADINMSAGPQGMVNANACHALPAESMQASAPDYQEQEPVERLELAAGARIDQRVYKDDRTLDYWQETPAGMILINYCDQELCDRLVKIGMQGSQQDGFLAGLPIGHQ